MYTASATNSKLLYITQSPNPPNTVLHTPIDYQLYNYVWNRSETEYLQI
jgi:hypothetical protein